jgi:methionyl-tRNA formyltransferase|tara:strand:+ start:827 stop:1501 length:675 start_codon:yes stop_codon:yes gene_type:complete
MSETYVVCGYKSWNRNSFDTIVTKYPGNWHFVSSKEELTMELLKELQPRYVFFLHWSWIVPEEMLTTYECVNFHLTDLPFGRGGSPLQNLIVRGINKETKLTAIRMVNELDAGPIYLKTDLSLEGTAQEILTRQSDQSAKMIEKIIIENPEPKEQEGEVVVFTRRTPEMSEIPEELSPEQRFDFIRMLDAEGYPPAYEIIDGVRHEYRNAKLENGVVEADSAII